MPWPRSVVTEPGWVPGGMVISVGPVEDRVDGNRGAQRGVDHRHRDGAVQVVAVADEDVVRLLVHLDVQVTGRAAAGADLALGGQPHPHAVADTGGDLDADLAAGPHPAVAAAAVARIGDDLADAARTPGTAATSSPGRAATAAPSAPRRGRRRCRR